MNEACRSRLKRLWQAFDGAADITYPAPVHSRRADVLVLVGRWPEAEEIYRDVMSHSRQAGDRQTLAEAAVQLSCLQRYMGEGQDHLELLEEALELFIAAGHAVGINQALNHIGLAHMSRGEFGRAAEYFRQLQDRAQRTGDAKHLAGAWGNLGQVHLYQGEFPEAQRCFEQCAGLCRQANDTAFLGVACLGLGNVLFYQDQLELALAQYHQCMNIAVRMGDVQTQSVAIGNIGNVVYKQGDLGRALAYYQEKLKLSLRLNFKRGINQALCNIGGVHTDLGQFQDALLHFDRLQEAAAESNDQEDLEGAHSGRAAVLSHLGDFARAEKSYLAALAIDRELGLKYELSSNLRNLAELYFKMGDSARTREMADQARTVAAEIGNQDVLHAVRLLQARMAGREDLGRGAALLRDMLAGCSDDGQRASVHYYIFLLTGDPGHQARALALFRELHARTPLYELQQRIGELEAAEMQ